MKEMDLWPCTNDSKNMACSLVVLMLYVPVNKFFPPTWDDFLSSWVEPVLSSRQSVLLKDTPQGLRRRLALNLIHVRHAQGNGLLGDI